MYEVTNTALPRTGLRGVEKTAEKTAWTKSTAESGVVRSRTSRCSEKSKTGWITEGSEVELQKDTGNGEGLSEGVEGGAPGDLPGGDVGQHKAQLVQQVPHLEVRDVKYHQRQQ